MLGLGNARGGGISSTQGGIIVPDPASNTRYYLLTVDDLESISDIYWPHNGIVYYLIDMQLVGGLGEADLPGFKNLEGLPRQSYGRKNSAAMTFRHRRVIQFFGKQTPASIISWV